MNKIAGKVVSHIATGVWGFDIIVFTDGSGLRPCGDERGIDIVLMSAECVALMLSLNDVPRHERFKRSQELHDQIFASDEVLNPENPVLVA